MRTRRLSRPRRFAWLWFALLIVVATGGYGDERFAHASAQRLLPEQVSDGQFILRASPATIDGIAARLGLTVLGHVPPDIYLVAGSPDTASLAATSGSLAPSPSLTGFDAGALLDPQVVSFEANAVVVTPEIGAGVELNHSTVEILDSLGNRTLVDHFGRPAWNGYVNQPAAHAIRLADTHAASATGAGIVAIIDTGVDPNHPLLQGVLVPGYDFVHDTAGEASEWSDLDHSTVEILDHSTVEILDSNTAPVPLNQSTVALLNSGSALDPAQLPAAFGHGTMVAGIVHLVAPTAKIMPLKAFSADGTSRTFDIVRAIYYAVDHGARVINLSFSAAGVSTEIARAINYATDRGVVCVASVGNLGREVVIYPGGFRNVLGVASSNSASPPTRSSFSNYGDALVSLAAPGEGIITTYPGGSYAGAWGTSFSTPIVAGGVALLLQIDPSLNYQKANDQLARAVVMNPGMGKGRLNLYEATRTLPDAVAPSASLLTPSSAGVIAGDVLVSASASDNVAVTGVKFLLDGSPLGVEDTAAPYEISWPTGTASNGDHVVTAIARDAAGNVASSTARVTVENDLEPPTVTLVSPARGMYVSGTVTVSATASDDIGVVGVRFSLDGAPAGEEDLHPPYELAWHTGPVSDGPHAWTVVARDAAGKEASSTSSVMVTHDITAPTVSVTGPAAYATVSGVITITAATADDVGITSLQWVLDGTPLGTPITSPPYQATWSTLAHGNGTHTLTAVARDAVGHVTTADPVIVTVRNDLAAPTVGLVLPAPGATVEGVIRVSAAAADDVGVTSVQFFLDGAPLAEVDLSAPYEVEWPTLSAANGAHTLSAIARDAAGGEATATAVVVNVRNDLEPPTVTLATPSAGPVNGTVTVTALAVDDVGVTSVQFFLDGAPLGEVDLAAPYEVEWPTLSGANGAHTLSAVARDAAGREATADALSLTVLNDLATPTVGLVLPAPGATVEGVIRVSAAAADDVGVTSVQFFLDGAPLGEVDLAAPYEVEWPTLSAANGAHTLSAIARDAAGRETTATAVVVNVRNDLAPPTVTLASPSAGPVNGTVTVTALAADDVGVTSVQFLLDGAPLGAARHAAPYAVEWPTTSVANGAHTLSAVARDAAGREATADAVSLTVLNDLAAPTVGLVLPAPGATVEGVVRVSAAAADDVGVTSVQFLVDGTPLGEVDLAAPYEVEWPTPSAANGAHTLSAIAHDAAGREATAMAVVVNVRNDLEPPTVTLATPSPGTVNGTVTVTALAVDDVGVTSVQFLLDGAPLAELDLAAPYEIEWPTLSAANGAHTLSAIARDAAGREATATAVVVNVRNDLEPPTVTLASPSAGPVDGTVTVTALAVDDVGVTSVQFFLDGAPLGEVDLAAPYEVEWPTPSVANGAHTLSAVARDAAGRETTATAVVVNVRNDLAPPTVTLASPSAGTVNGTVTVTALAADDVGVTSVQFLLDGAPLGAARSVAPYEVEWPTPSVANGAHTLSAVARDAAGREATADAVSLTVLNDLAAPTVGLVLPAPGATVEGVIRVSAAAADDVGVTSVQFLVDGTPLGEVDLAAPYEVEWPTLSAANGAHTLSAIARDAAGRETTATAVVVNVRNDLEPPTVALVSPARGMYVSGTVTVSATASDDIGVVGVRFSLDGAPAGEEDLHPPYELAWPTGPVSDGPHVWTVVARDAAGKEASSTSSVMVTHDITAPTVSVTRPPAYATVSGVITITAATADDVGITSLQWVLDGTPLGTPITSPPYQATWSTLAYGNGTHTLTAVARDAVGHVTTATPVIVTVRNDLAAPTVGLVLPAPGATVEGVIRVSAAAADDVGVTSVQFLLDGAPLDVARRAAPYEVEWPTPSVANGAHTLSAVARDAAGRETTATAVVVNVRNDLAPPTVTLASPSAGPVNGTVTVTALAVDDVGVTSVQFFLDGAPLGAARSVAPYAVEWPTTTAENGAHTITAVARDGAGREATSSVSIVVSNEPPQ